MYEIDDPVIKNRLRSIAEQIKKFLPSGWGFTLFLFGFGKDKGVFYISNANREDMVKTIKAWLAKQDSHAATAVTCKHEHLDMEGYCHKCGADCRSGS